jgi:hypothetical protein
MAGLQQDRIEYRPLDEATKPRDGEVLVDRWWVVHPKKGLTFYNLYGPHSSPQCNHNEAICRSITKDLYPDHEVLFVPVVYLGWPGRTWK